MKTLSFLVLFLAFLSISSSYAGEEKKFPMQEAIQPRHKGAFWLYKSYYLEGDKKVPSGLSKEEVLEVKQIEGVTCYSVRLTVDWRSLVDRLSGVKLEEEDYIYTWEYPTDKGIHFFEPNDDKKIPNKLADFKLVYPYPVKVGEKYQAFGTNYEVIDVARKTKVPAGEFSCVVYQLTYPDDEIKPADEDEEMIKSRDRLFLAKGVGIVVAEGDIWEDGKWVIDYRDELSSYQLKPEEGKAKKKGSAKK